MARKKNDVLDTEKNDVSDTEKKEYLVINAFHDGIRRYEVDEVLELEKDDFLNELLALNLVVGR